MRSELACAFAALWLAGFASGAEILERVLAVVDDRPIFLSDVRTVEWLDHLDRQEARERVIDESLLIREANRLPQTAPATAPEGERLREGPAGEEALARVLARRAAIQRYAAFRFRPQIRVDEEAVRRAYGERWGNEAGAPSFEASAAALREQLTAEAVAQRVQVWVKDLRAVAHIRYNALD